MEGIKTQTRCRICLNEELTEFLDLGKQPLANIFLRKEEVSRSEPMYPLRVAFCNNCGLSQLMEVVDPEILFSHYIYFSGSMPSSPHFTAYAQEVIKRFISSPQDLLVEVGSNDGHFLRLMKERGIQAIGVDPARNIAELANRQGLETIPDFFSARVAERILHEKGQAKVMIANNVVAHTDDHHDLARGISTLLAPDGIFILEAPHMIDMFENLAFDTIYHEHMSYLSVRPLIYLFAQYDMEVFDAKLIPSQHSQGLSLRLYACKKGTRSILSSVRELSDQEKNIGMHEFLTYLDLTKRITSLKKEIVDIVKDIKRCGKTIACYGAPAKGNTLLNYFGLGADIISFATEELPSKIGLLTPGMHIPVIHINDARNNPPDYYLLLAWNYKNVILEKEKEFRANGGKFIIPVGTERIV